VEQKQASELSAGPEEISEILRKYRVVAVVGLSDNPSRPSHQVAHYLQQHGYRIVPINPRGRDILGEKCYASLREVPFPIEVVDIFRNVEAIPAIVAEAIEVGAKVVWMQLGLVEPESAQKAKKAGLRVVMDHCLKIEHAAQVT
jgi:predicted CoA-binding protein